MNASDIIIAARRPAAAIAMAFIAASAPGRAAADIVPGLEQYGEVTLVDSIDCAIDATHMRRDYPTGRSFVTNILGEACVAMRHVAKGETPLGAECSAYLAWRVGRASGIVPNDPYVLVIEYPDDAPRSATVMNFGTWTHHGFATGFAVPDSMSPPYVAQVLESYAIPLSNRFLQFKEVMFPMQRCQQVESAIKDGAALFDLPENGFDVVFALFPQEDSTDSAGVAVKSIRLYHIDEFDSARPEIHYPAGDAPRRHVTFREEMGDNYAMQGYASGQRALAYQAKSRLMTLLGVDTVSRDMLEFGYLQGWSSSYSGNPDGRFGARTETVENVRTVVTDPDTGETTTNTVRHTSYDPDPEWHSGPSGQIDANTVVTVTTNRNDGYQHWASSEVTWPEIIGYMAEEGHYILPYYEYSGSRGPRGWGSQGHRPMMLNTEGYGSGQGWSNQSWINAATADLTEPGTREDFKDILDLTMLRFANTEAYTNMFLGAWMRNRAQVPMGFSDRAVARFATDESSWLMANGYDPARVTRLSIHNELQARKAALEAANGKMSSADASQYWRWGAPLYNRYRHWWYLQRRDFFAAMRDYMSTNGIPEARMFYHSCTAEPGEQWDTWWPPTSIYAGEGADSLWNGMDWKGLTGSSGNSDMTALAALYRTRALDTDFSNFWGLEVNHSAPADDYYNYGSRATLAGSPQYRIGLSYPYSRVYQTVDPSLADDYRNASGDLFFVHHYSLNEHALQDKNLTNATYRMSRSGIADENYFKNGQHQQICGYFCSDYDHAGRAVVLSELWAMAVADPTILARLYGTNIGQLDSGYFREFNLNFLSLPAQPGELLLGGSWGDTLHVRRWTVAASGDTPACSYYAVINTGLHSNETARIHFDGASGHVYRTVDFAEIDLDADSCATIPLEPLQMIAFRTLPPDAPAVALSASAASTTAIRATADVLALPSGTGSLRVYCSTARDISGAVPAKEVALDSKGSHRIDVDGLDPGVKYFITAVVEDAGGAQTVRTVSVRTVSDPAFPQASVSASCGSASAATLTTDFSTLGEGATSATIYATVRAAGSLFPPQQFVFHGVTHPTAVDNLLTNLSSSLEYTVTATITNNLGNGCSAGSATFATTAVPSEDPGAGRWLPGLNQHRFHFTSKTKAIPDLSVTANGHDDTERVPYPLMGAAGNASIANPFTGNEFEWTKDSATGYRGCYMYEGAMWFEAGIDYNFFIRFCDNGAMTIDGGTFISGGYSGGYSSTFYATTNYPAAGWHHIKAFFWAFDGSYGPMQGTMHGLGWNTNGVTSVSSSNAGTEWSRLEDPGDGSLLRTYDDWRTLVELDKPLSRDGTSLVVPVSIESFDADNTLTVFASFTEPGAADAQDADWWTFSANGAAPGVGTAENQEVALPGCVPGPGATVYAVARLANARTGRVDWSLVASYTAPSDASAPEFSAYVEAAGHHGATLAVRMPSLGQGASGATVTATVSGGGKTFTRSLEFNAAGAMALEIDGLSPSTAYAATLEAVASTGAQSSCPVVLSFTTPAPDPPSAALFASLVAFTNETFVVDVASLGTDSESARIVFEFSTDATFSTDVTTVRRQITGPGQHEFALPGLRNGTEYFARATIAASNGKSAQSKTIRVPTLAFTIPVFGPISALETWPDRSIVEISVTSIGAGAESVAMSWTLSGADGDVASGLIDFTRPGTSALALEGLEPGRSYALALSAINSNGLSAQGSYSFATPQWLVALGEHSARVSADGQEVELSVSLRRASAGSTLALYINGSQEPSRTWQDVQAGTLVAELPATLGTTNAYRFVAADATGRYAAEVSGAYIARRTIDWFAVEFDDPGYTDWPDVSGVAAPGGEWSAAPGDESRYEGTAGDGDGGPHLEVRPGDAAPLGYIPAEPAQSNRCARIEGRSRFSASAAPLGLEDAGVRAGLALHIDAGGDERLYAWNGSSWDAIEAVDGTPPPESGEWTSWVAEFEPSGGALRVRFSIGGAVQRRVSDSAEWIALSGTEAGVRGIAWTGSGAIDDFDGRWYSFAESDVAAGVETNETAAVISLDVDRVRDGGSEVLVIYGAEGSSSATTNSLAVAAPGTYEVALKSLLPGAGYWVSVSLDGRENAASAAFSAPEGEETGENLHWFSVELDDPGYDSWPDISSVETPGGAWTLIGDDNASAFSAGERTILLDTGDDGIVCYTPASPSPSGSAVHLEGEASWLAYDEIPPPDEGTFAALALGPAGSGNGLAFYASTGAAWAELAFADGSAAAESQTPVAWTADFDFSSAHPEVRYTVGGKALVPVDNAPQPVTASPATARRLSSIAWRGTGVIGDFLGDYETRPSTSATLILSFF